MTLLNKIKIIKNYWPVSKFYFYSFFKKNRPFLGLFFQITDRCNSRCLMCFNWKKINKISNELSLNEIEKITKIMGHIPSLTIGGGEPFLRDDLSKICQIFSRNNQVNRISIPTNCLLPDKIVDSVEKILKSCKLRLAIILSLDGIGETHNYIRGIEGNFYKVLETYKKLKHLSKKYPQLKINVNTTISNKNEDEITKIINFVDDNFELGFHTMETIRGHYNKKNIQAPSIEKYEKLIPELLKSKTINNGGFHKRMYSYYHKLALNILKEKKQLIPCRAALFMPVIDAVGNVYNCELLPSIGNIRDTNYDFLKIWRSKKAKKQRKDIVNKKCYCTHYCYQIQNIPMSPFHFLKAILK